MLDISKWGSKKAPIHLEDRRLMKIALNMGEKASPISQAKVTESEILSAKKGDWTSLSNIQRAFHPLLTSLAQKRTTDPAQVANYVEAGKEGIATAVRKYKQSIGASRFSIFIVDYIHEAMDTVDKKKRGFFARLFSRH